MGFSVVPLHRRPFQVIVQGQSDAARVARLRGEVRAERRTGAVLSDDSHYGARHVRGHDRGQHRHSLLERRARPASRTYSAIITARICHRTLALKVAVILV